MIRVVQANSISVVAVVHVVLIKQAVRRVRDQDTVKLAFGNVVRFEVAVLRTVEIYAKPIIQDFVIFETVLGRVLDADSNPAIARIVEFNAVVF